MKNKGISEEKIKGNDQKFVVLQKRFSNLEQDCKDLLQENMELKKKNEEKDKIIEMLQRKKMVKFIYDVLMVILL